MMHRPIFVARLGVNYVTRFNFRFRMKMLARFINRCRPQMQRPIAQRAGNISLLNSANHRLDHFQVQGGDDQANI